MKDRKAFVIVDMQNDYCHPDGAYPRHGLRCLSLESAVVATAAFAARCKRHGVPMIHLRMAFNVDKVNYPIDAGLIVETSRPFLRHEGLRRGTWGAEFLEEIPPGDYVIDKTRYSGFHNTALEALLRGLEVDTVMLAGVVTNVCVEATARDAFHRDFGFIVLRDCVAAFTAEAQEASLKTLQIFGRVATSEDIELQDARHVAETKDVRAVAAE